MVQQREAAGLDRRKLLLAAGGTIASAGLAKSLSWPASGGAATSRALAQSLLPAPKPIPGGRTVAGHFIHFFSPHPRSSLDIEPSTMTDFKGSSALAYLVGSATGSDGQTYDVEVDIRAFQGQYVGVDGSSQQGSFAEL
jgi:hypothetical protein